MSFSENDARSEGRWIVQMVEKGFVGEYTTHVLESNNTAHIVYFDWLNGNLKHAVNGPDGWVIETVDQEGTVGQYAAIAREDRKSVV